MKMIIKLLTVLLLVLCAQAALANGPTEIDNCDATVYSSDEGETILVTSDIVKDGDGDCIQINHDYVTVDCDGHRITGIGQTFGYYGVWSVLVDNTTVTNCTFEGWLSAVTYWGTSYGLIFNNKAESIQFGFRLLGGSDNVVDDNKSVDSLYSGILLVGSSDNVVSNNFVTGSSCDSSFHGLGGIVLNESVGNTVVDNQTSANCDSGIRLQNESDSNFIWSNKSDGNQAGYYEDGIGITITSLSEGNELIRNSTNRNSSFGLKVNPELVASQFFENNRCKQNGDGGSSPSGLCKD